MLIWGPGNYRVDNLPTQGLIRERSVNAGSRERRSGRVVSSLGDGLLTAAPSVYILPS